MSLTLVVGNKNYSSWSLRAYLVMQLSGAPYREQLEPLYAADSAARLASHSPSAKVPVLHSEHGSIWDSLAIAEYLAERFPEAQLWPRDPAARALARSVCAQMHSSFTALRSHMPMDMQRQQPLASVPAEVRAEIEQVCGLWQLCLQHPVRSTGEFLFGAPSIADAFFAPVVSRLHSYGVALPAAAERYAASVRQWPAYQAWLAAAQQETQLAASSV